MAQQRALLIGCPIAQLRRHSAVWVSLQSRPSRIIGSRTGGVSIHRLVACMIRCYGRDQDTMSFAEAHGRTGLMSARSVYVILRCRMSERGRCRPWSMTSPAESLNVAVVGRVCRARARTRRRHRDSEGYQDHAQLCDANLSHYRSPRQSKTCTSNRCGFPGIKCRYNVQKAS